MATPLYDAFVVKVRDWANRDSTALPPGVIDDALMFSSDEANRRLKIPALEGCQFYYVLGGSRTDASTGVVTEITTVPSEVTAMYPNAVGVSIATLSNTIAFSGQELQLPVPVDTTTFISLRIAQSGNSNHAGVVFNEKVDIRTYFDQEAHIRNANVWMRQSDLLHVIGLFGHEDVLELFYHKRLPDPNAIYDVTSANLVSRLLTLVPADQTSGTPVAPAVFGGSLIVNSTDNQTDTEANIRDYIEMPSITEFPYTFLTSGGVTVYFDGDEVFNWLRDENVRVLLFGALYQCFDYLGDADMSQKYVTKFASSIEELNEEEKKRTASGGNVQVNYSSYLLSGGAFF